MKKTKKQQHEAIVAQIGRLGPEAAINLRTRPAGILPDRRTRRNRTRSDQRRSALLEQ